MMILVAIGALDRCLSLPKRTLLGSMVVLFYACSGGGMHGNFRSTTLLTTRSFCQAGRSRSSFPLGFAADDGDMVGARAVYVVDDIIDEEESPWAYGNDTQQHLFRSLLVCMFA